jgi:hypothetical protein
VSRWGRRAAPGRDARQHSLQLLQQQFSEVMDGGDAAGSGCSGGLTSGSRWRRRGREATMADLR